MKDRSTSIFICANGKDDMDDVPEGLRSFLNYVLDGTVSDDLTRRLDMAVKQAQANEEWGQEYMELWMKYNEFREDGIEIGRELGIEMGREEGREMGREEGREMGREEGREEGRENLILEMVKDGDITPELGAKKLGISPDEMQLKLAEK